MGTQKNYLAYLSSFLKYNPMIALGALLDEILGERRYRLSTTGFEKPRFRSLNSPSAFHAYSYMPSNYVLLESVFSRINTLKHNSSFLDIGCGKGRAMIVAAHFGFKHIDGIDISQDLCDIAIRQLEKNKGLFPGTSFSVTCADAALFKIGSHIQTIFLYNPFKEPIIDLLIANIFESLTEAARPLFVIYLNPLFKRSFQQAGFKEIYAATRFFYLKASVLCLDPTLTN